MKEQLATYNTLKRYFYKVSNISIKLPPKFFQGHSVHYNLDYIHKKVS